MNILVLENDFELDNELSKFIQRVKENNPESTVNILYDFKNKDKQKIYNAVSEADFIVSQTTLVNTWQIDEMFRLLSKFPKQKNILFTSEYTVEDLCNYLLDNKDIHKIDHHKIGHFSYYDIDFSKAIYTNILTERADILRAELAKEKEYRDTAPSRPTGRKIRVLDVVAFGSAFNGLDNGMILDELIMSDQDNQPSRGVWVWGNGEPVKLLRERNAMEYEIVK